MIRRSWPKFGFEEWQIALLNRAISPGSSSKLIAVDSSMGASMYCSRESRLLVPNASLCARSGPVQYARRDGETCDPA